VGSNRDPHGIQGGTLEGVEVIVIVIALGASRVWLIPASLGALAACLLVVAAAWPCIARSRVSRKFCSSSLSEF